MTITWQLVILFQLNVIKITTPSIAGVTYMDHFDFEERYRDIYECDPFYWHPLHLPDHCAEMYEKLIHSKIASRTPVRIVKEKEHVVYKLNYNPFTINSEVVAPTDYYDNNDNLTPYEKMFAYLKKDITRHPKAPTIEVMPNFGPVAVYRQPISKKSEVMIKKIAQAYAEVQPAAPEDDGFFGQIDIKSGDKIINDTIHEPTTNSNKIKPLKIKKKLKNGHIVTIKKITIMVMTVNICRSTISGISYMDPYNFRRYPNTPTDNPCNPLYWYPRSLPDTCYDTTTTKPKDIDTGRPIPLPIPVPMPQPIPIAMMPNSPLPYGVPLAPTNPMVPVGGFPYPYYPYPRQAGMVPGVPGIVSPDGGINILPFSDVYADVIERRKRKRLNKKLRRILDEYEGRRW